MLKTKLATHSYHLCKGVYPIIVIVSTAVTYLGVPYDFCGCAGCTQGMANQNALDALSLTPAWCIAVLSAEVPAVNA